MTRGIIISKKKQKAVVLTEDGCFHSVRLKKAAVNLKVGQHISSAHFHPNLLSIRRFPVLIMYSVLLLAIILLVLQLYFNNKVVAYVSYDVDPGLEASINRHMKVLSVEPLNDEAKALLKSEDMEAHPSIETFTDKVIDSLIQQGYVDRDGEIVMSTVVTDKVKKQEHSHFESQLTDVLNRTQKEQLLRERNTHFAILHASEESRNIARKYGLTVGKYMLYQTLFGNSTEFTLDQVKEMTIGEMRNMAQSIAETDPEPEASESNDEETSSQEPQPKTATPFATHDINDSRDLNIESESLR
ncbi:hypothetical protein JOD43_000563 [Pullulanibacillus pueri]|uniref:RsgI N-terminal anti-sigma domain-containing protein n=1 Tax=Pullulanibacillus pueri TaxID=1437324 RepID=A0A8J3EL65_9BACL|nr:anti-sigma factor domain-containing protein [Pullulanibacillus pueri]MBM7680404.1 hypothetical protein [Pullulanibacillus pueri]GGH75235.1 hypothetical protein GCM10007096_04260 [Pullulanibacillus pueri]